MAMQATLPLDRPITIARNLPRETTSSSDATSAAVEIHAYLAARNLFFQEAEGHPSEANLRRAAAANDFAEECLQSPRSPYEKQTLPEAEIAGERQRCEAVKMRLAELRVQAGLRRHAA